MKMNFMMAPLSAIIFNKIFEIKGDSLLPVLETYKVQTDDLKQTLWEEFNIPGMEVRIANTAFDWLIDCCEANYDLAETLRAEIKRVILGAAIFYTNVAPEAISDRDWNPESRT